MNPGVGDGGHFHFRAFGTVAVIHQARAEHGDAFGLGEPNQAQRHIHHDAERLRPEHGGQRIDHQAARLVLANQGLDIQQMLFAIERTSLNGMKAQIAVCDCRGQIEADGRHVADDLAAALVEADVQAALGALDAGMGEGRSQRRFGGAGRASHQDGTAAQIATAKHRVEPLHARRDALGESGKTHLVRHRHGHFDAVRADDQREFPFVDRRAAVFGHAQIAMGEATDDVLAQMHDAIGHVLEEVVSGPVRLVGSTRPGSDDAGDAVDGQPVLNAVELLPLRERVVEQRQQHVDRVEHDACGMVLGKPGADAGQESADIETPGLHDIGRHAGIHECEFVLASKIPAERSGVGNDALRIFFECDENAAFAVQERAIDQCLQGEHGLATTGPANKGACAPMRQAAPGNRVKPLDAGGGFFHSRNVSVRHEDAPRRRLEHADWLIGQQGRIGSSRCGAKGRGALTWAEQ